MMTGKEPSLMRREILEIPEAVERLLTEGEAALEPIVRAAVAADPRFVVTVARGSSDHACSYLKYASELLLGLPVASVGPSVASIYKAPLRVAHSLCLAVSQSGRSPDIVEMAGQMRRDGAYTVAITNDDGAPLARAADAALPIFAGPERSVAATKTFVASALAGLWILARMKGDASLLAAIRALPPALAAAAAVDWAELRHAAVGSPSLYALGRGPAWAIAHEAALKFKEICRIHAEGFSSAEVLHGPVSIVGEGFPVVGFAAADAAEGPLVEVADALAEKGAQVFVTSDRVRRAARLDHIRTGHPLTDPLPLIVSFYSAVERVAHDLGIDPDLPRHLRKVTETV